MDRRDFLKKAALVGVAGAGLARTLGAIAPVAAAEVTLPELIVAKGGEPAALLRAALQAYGGLGKLIKPGANVVIKANFSWVGGPEQACNTNPDLLHALVKTCLQAGAGKVTVVDFAIDFYGMTLYTSGIDKAVKAAGGVVKNLDAFNKKASPVIEVESGPLKGYELFAEALQADCLINAPIVKSHSNTPMTCALKSIMGLTPDRGRMHMEQMGLESAIVELNKVVKYNLHLIDAYRVLKTNGPHGPGDVVLAKELILTRDPVAGDAYAAGLLGVDPRKVPHLQEAAKAGLGVADLSKVKIKRVKAG